MFGLILGPACMDFEVFIFCTVVAGIFAEIYQCQEFHNNQALYWMILTQSSWLEPQQWW